MVDLRMNAWHVYGIKGDINGRIHILQKGHEEKLCLLLTFWPLDIV